MVSLCECISAAPLQLRMCLQLLRSSFLPLTASSDSSPSLAALSAKLERDTNLWETHYSQIEELKLCLEFLGLRRMALKYGCSLEPSVALGTGGLRVLCRLARNLARLSSWGETSYIDALRVSDFVRTTMAPSEKGSSNPFIPDNVELAFLRLLAFSGGRKIVSQVVSSVTSWMEPAQELIKVTILPSLSAIEKYELIEKMLQFVMMSQKDYYTDSASLLSKLKKAKVTLLIAITQMLTEAVGSKGDSAFQKRLKVSRSFISRLAQLRKRFSAEIDPTLLCNKDPSSKIPLTAFLSLWQSKLRQVRRERAEVLFRRVAADRLDNAAQALCVNVGKPALTVTFPPRKVAPLRFLATRSTSNFSGHKMADLLQLGELVGLDGGTVRQGVVRRAAELCASPEETQKSVGGRWLGAFAEGVHWLCELFNKHSRDDALSILALLEQLVSEVSAKSTLFSIALAGGFTFLSALSEMLDLAVCCLGALPREKLQGGVRFVWALYLTMQILVNSDLLDTTANNSNNSETQFLSQLSESFIYVPVLSRSLINEAIRGQGIAEKTERRIQRELFISIFEGFSALLPKKDALRLGLGILALTVQMNGATTSEELSHCRRKLSSCFEELADLLITISNYELTLVVIGRHFEYFSTARYKDVASMLYSAVTDSTIADHELAISLALIIGVSAVWERFTTRLPTLSDADHVAFHSRLVVDVGLLSRSLDVVSAGVQTLLRARWRSVFDDHLNCNYNVKRFQQILTFSDLSVSNVYCEQEMLPLLLSSSNSNLDLACRFGHDFLIPKTKVLCLWLKSTLIVPHAKINGRLNTDYLFTALPVIHQLRSDSLIELLESDVLPFVSPYDYTRIEFILNHSKSTSALIVLHYLKEYTRHQQPSDEEVSRLNLFLKDKSPDTLPIFETLSKLRLPFHRVMEEPWEVIGPELNKSTLDSFLPMLPLKLKADDVHLQRFWNAAAVNTTPIQQLLSALDDCFKTSPLRAMAAAWCLVELSSLISGRVRLSVALWAAHRLAPSSRRRNEAIVVALHHFNELRIDDEQSSNSPDLENICPKGSDETFIDSRLLTMKSSTSLRDGFPRWIAPVFAEALKVSKVSDKSRVLGDFWWHAGLLRAQLSLSACHLSPAFAAFLPECPILCLHALVHFLAPILLRPNPYSLANAKQHQIFSALTGYPSSLHVPTNETTTQNDRQAESLLPKLAAPSSLSELVQLICSSFGLNFRVALLALFNKFLRNSHWTPQACVTYLESKTPKNSEAATLVGSTEPPSPKVIAKCREALAAISSSELTEGLDWWYEDQEDTSWSVGQSLDELRSRQRAFLLAQLLELKHVMKSTLEVALRNERTQSRSERAMAVAFAVASSPNIQTFYNQPPTKLLDLWKHYVYLDAFESIGVGCQIANFFPVEKSSFIRALWRNVSRQSVDRLSSVDFQVLCTIALMSNDFAGVDARFFGALLTRLFFAATARPKTVKQKAVAKQRSLALVSCGSESSSIFPIPPSSTTLISSTLKLSPSSWTTALLFRNFVTDFVLQRLPELCLDDCLSDALCLIFTAPTRAAKDCLLSFTDVPAQMAWFLEVPCWLSRLPNLNPKVVKHVAKGYLELQSAINSAHEAFSQLALNTIKQSSKEVLCRLLGAFNRQWILSFLRQESPYAVEIFRLLCAMAAVHASELYYQTGAAKEAFVLADSKLSQIETKLSQIETK